MHPAPGLTLPPLLPAFPDKQALPAATPVGDQDHLAAISRAIARSRVARADETAPVGVPAYGQGARNGSFSSWCRVSAISLARLIRPLSIDFEKFSPMILTHGEINETTSAMGEHGLARRSRNGG
jgi:hypothetical protein